MLPKDIGNLGRLGGMATQTLALKAKMEELTESLWDERVEAGATFEDL